MASPQVRINGIDYTVEVPRNGHPVTIDYNEQFIEAQSLTGGQTQEGLKGRSTRTFGPWTSGHTYNRIPEKEDGNPLFLKGFWDSDGVQTWFDGDARLPILEVDSTEAGLEVIRASVSFKDELWGMWEDDTSTDLVARNFTGSTTTWENGGDILADGNTKVGLDMIAHQTHLIAGLVTTNDHVIMRSTDGATWSAASTPLSLNELSDNVTANEDIDAGLLATIGTEVVWVEWRETSGDITFHSSSDIGDNWAGEAPGIASGNGPQGVGVITGIDDALKLYVMAREGLYEVDVAPPTWTVTPVYPMAPHNDNGRRMVAHNGDLYFAHGVDNNSPAPITRMWNSDGTRHFETGWGLDVRDGVPDDMLGPIRWMKSAGPWLIASVGGGTTSRQARIIVRNTLNPETGWHTARKHGTENQKIEWIEYSADDDGTPRLHYSVRTAAATSNTKSLANPLTNPQSGATINRELTGTLVLPEFDGGMATTPATFLQQRINAVDLSASTAGEYVNANYGVDGAARTTNLEDFLSGAKNLSHASGAGVSGTSYGASLDFHRDGAANTDTPKVRSLEVVYKKIPSELITARFTINVAKQYGMSPNPMLPAKQVRTNLEAARDLTTLPAFAYTDVGTKYVKVRLLQSREKLIQHSGGGEGAQNTFWIREGLIDVECEEIA